MELKSKYIKEDILEEFAEFLKRNRDRDKIDGSSKYDKYIQGKVKDINIEFFDAKEDPWNKIILECSRTDDVRDIYLTSSLRVLTGNIKTVRVLSDTLDKISYEDFQSGKLILCLETLYRNKNHTFYGSEYMPLLIRASSEEEKTLKTMKLFNDILSYSSTIKLEHSTASLYRSLKQINGIGDFYINRILFMLNLFTTQLEEDYIGLGPGSEYSLHLLCKLYPKNQRALLFIMRELQRLLKEKDIEISISNIENSLCEFQKCYRNEKGLLLKKK